MISDHKTANTCDNGSKQLDKKSLSHNINFRLQVKQLLLQH
jgi:hypothetical protein